jgi:hypothetical protein
MYIQDYKALNVACDGGQHCCFDSGIYFGCCDNGKYCCGSGAGGSAHTWGYCCEGAGLDCQHDGCCQEGTTGCDDNGKFVSP